MTNGTARRSILKTITGALAMAAAAAKPKPGAVTQAELQQVIDMQNRAEVLAANIRARLEAGAALEHGKLCVTTFGAKPLDWYREHGGIGVSTTVDEISGLTIEPAEKIGWYLKMRQENPDYKYNGIALA